jgi:hypothetical protein
MYADMAKQREGIVPPDTVLYSRVCKAKKYFL